MMKAIVISLVPLLLLPACSKTPEDPGPSRKPLVPQSSSSRSSPPAAMEDARARGLLSLPASRKPVTRWM